MNCLYCGKPARLAKRTKRPLKYCSKNCAARHWHAPLKKEKVQKNNTFVPDDITKAIVKGRLYRFGGIFQELVEN